MTSIFPHRKCENIFIWSASNWDAIRASIGWCMFYDEVGLRYFSAGVLTILGSDCILARFFFAGLVDPANYLELKCRSNLLAGAAAPCRSCRG